MLAVLVRLLSNLALAAEFMRDLTKQASASTLILILIPEPISQSPNTCPSDSGSLDKVQMRRFSSCARSAPVSVFSALRRNASGLQV